ncbi:unknown [Orgyia pseudotsugata multiple nucleopolyhedrovirus]|uniref:Uncharacterized protein n=1 Tax=Orgyia pseudotsugata multicapsid polyhedrosis virus TaxID=262177 RepID=O10357_NPVOP|nr:hypothetical protein OpmnVgp118 [Orgyia pseudotsugata multiple nucleopolyhedrovirus]AAC59117.1 unknown [Orgyia pseudotsugata multiple nucleopolyhedrovirus]
MKTKQSLQANKNLLIEKTFLKSPKSLQNLAKTAFINSNGFRARFWDHVRTMPSAVKLDVMRALFDGARTILENDALDNWPPVNENVLEALLFGDRGGHNFTGQDDAVDVVRKLRCDGCGRQNGGSVVNACRRTLTSATNAALTLNTHGLTTTICAKSFTILITGARAVVCNRCLTYITWKTTINVSGAPWCRLQQQLCRQVV